MREVLVQSLLHAAVAAAVVEAILAAWRPGRPDERLALRGVALALPILGPLVLQWAAPFRESPAFADTWALFASRHWTGLRLAGVEIGRLVLILSVLAGAWLYGRDLVPVLRERRRRGRHDRRVPPDTALTGVVTGLAGRLRLSRAPQLELLDESAPVVFAAGGTRPTLVISRGVLERLDPAALRAALAHELAHVAKGDLVFGWVLMSARTLMVFNPFTQLVARAVALELERRADDLAAELTGDPGAVAAAIERLLPNHVHGWSGRAGIGWRQAAGGAVATRARAFALGERAARLRANWPPAPLSHPRLRVGLAAASLAALLFFVV